MTREEMLNKHFPPDGEDDSYELADADTEVDDTSDEPSISTEVDDFDPFDPASVKAYIASKIAEILALTHAIGEPTTPKEAEVEVAVVASETPMEEGSVVEDDSEEDDGYDETAREQELLQFRKDHPDVSTYAEQIRELMLSEGCRPEDAYAKIKAAEKEAEIRSQKTKRAEAVRSIGSGSAYPASGVTHPISPKATTKDILDAVKKELGIKSLRG